MVLVRSLVTIVTLCLSVSVNADPRTEASYMFPTTTQNHRELQDDTCSWNFISGGSPCQLVAERGKTTKVNVDGRCNYNQELGYYMAVCTGAASTSPVKFLRAHCKNSDCSECNEFVPGCDGLAGECGFIARNEQREPSMCSERRDPRSNVVDAAYGMMGTCAKPSCATQPKETLKPEPCSWRMRNVTNCSVFKSNGVSKEIIADGRCRRHDQVGYYIAVCTDKEKLAFRRAHCSNSDCTKCNEFKTRFRCKYENGECGSVSRDYAYVSGRCFQIVDFDQKRIFGYDFIGTCKNPSCAYTTTAIQPTPAPTSRPTLPTTPTPPTPAPTPRPTILTAFPLPPTAPPTPPPPPTPRPTPPPTPRPTPPPTPRPTPPPSPSAPLSTTQPMTPSPTTPSSAPTPPSSIRPTPLPTFPPAPTAPPTAPPSTPEPSAGPTTSLSPTASPTAPTASPTVPAANPTLNPTLSGAPEVFEDDSSDAVPLSIVGWTTTFSIMLSLFLFV